MKNFVNKKLAFFFLCLISSPIFAATITYTCPGNVSVGGTGVNQKITAKLLESSSDGTSKPIEIYGIIRSAPGTVPYNFIFVKPEVGENGTTVKCVYSYKVSKGPVVNTSQVTLTNPNTSVYSGTNCKVTGNTVQCDSSK